MKTKHNCDGNCRACWDDGYERGRDAIASAVSAHIAKLQATIETLEAKLAEVKP